LESIVVTCDRAKGRRAIAQQVRRGKRKTTLRQGEGGNTTKKTARRDCSDALPQNVTKRIMREACCLCQHIYASWGELKSSPETHAGQTEKRERKRRAEINGFRETPNMTKKVKYSNGNNASRMVANKRWNKRSF